LVETLNKHFPTTRTFGYITKGKRIALGLEKSHATDAYIIAGGEGKESRATTLYIKQGRRNNRSLSNFRDATFIDIRTGEKVSGSELNCGRRTRNKNLNTENLRKYRGEKLSDGCVRTRKQHYMFQPGDVVVFDSHRYAVAGMQNKGAYIKLKGLSKPVKTSLVKPYRFMKGLVAA